LTGSPDAVSIRPEKIHLLGANEAVPDGLQHVRGAVRDVVYLGMYKRYLIDLQGGGDLVVIEQNLDSHTLARGAPVTLAWRPEHLRRLA
jgi:ABC-type Fe3+/spermidine/putrescine transport system ATPase subunit